MEQPLKDYEVLLAVTGGIAAYKAADLTSKLVQAGAGVSVAMSGAATRFLAPLTFQAISARQVYTSLWQSADDFRSQHISLTDRADLMIVAPATANVLAKMASGIADDLVTALALSAQGACPILVAPAMNTRMWQARPTRENIAKLEGWGVHVVGPVEGFLACRTVGAGRMIEPIEILDVARKLLLEGPPRARGGD